MQPLAEPESPTALLDRLRMRGHPVRSVTAMAGDVSRRAYHRVLLEDGATAVLALHPPDLRETCRRSLRTGELLAGAGVRVAEVLDEDCGAGWLLLEDLGERTLYEHAHRPWSELEGWFEDAVAAIGRIAALPRKEVAELNPPLDRALLARELAQTREVFLEPLGLLGGLDGGEAAFHAALEALCARLGAETPVPCHRDFGARNLIPLGGDGAPRVGVLDHQDLRLGPPAYDLASLLNDSLFPPPEVEERLLELGLAGGSREGYHRAAAQRTLKAVGSYAAFARRGEDRHLRLVPPTLGRALDHLRRVPETAPVAPHLEELWGPALEGRGLDRLLPRPTR
jgi:hypothetical protein